MICLQVFDLNVIKRDFKGILIYLCIYERRLILFDSCNQSQVVKRLSLLLCSSCFHVCLYWKTVEELGFVQRLYLF